MSKKIVGDMVKGKHASVETIVTEIVLIQHHVSPHGSAACLRSEETCVVMISVVVLEKVIGKVFVLFHGYACRNHEGCLQIGDECL